MLVKRKVIKNGIQLTRKNKLKSYPEDCPDNCELCIGCKYLIDYRCECFDIKKKSFCSEITPLGSQSKYVYIYVDET